MVTDEALIELQVENATLRQQLKLALRRIDELEAKAATVSVASSRSTHAPAVSRRERKRRAHKRQPQHHRQPQRSQRQSAQPNPHAKAPKPIAAQTRGTTPKVVVEQPAPEVTPEAAHMGAWGRRAGALGRAASNTILLLSGQLMTWASTLILTAAYGRFLGAEKFGELYLATTFTALIGFPIEYSFNQQIVRDVAREPRDAHRYLTMALALKGTLWVGLYVFALLLSIALGYSPEQRWLIAVCGLMLLTSGITSTLISIQTAYMKVGLAKFGTVIEKGLDAGLAIFLLRAGAGVQVVALVLLFGSIMNMLWQIGRVLRMIGIRLVWDPSVSRSLVRSGLSFLAYGVLGIIYYRVDTVLLSMYGTDAAVGVYGAAYRLLDTLMFIPGIVLGAVISPMLSKYAVDDDSKLRLTVEKSTLAMLLCALPAAAGILVTAPNIIGFVYHRHDFVASAGVLQALAIGLIALYLNTVLTTVLVSTGHERKLPLLAAVALVFNVGLNLVVIPRYGAMGAAWATTATEALLLVVGLVLIDRALIPVQLWLPTVKIVIASVAMAVVAHALATYTIVVIMPIAAVVYFAAVTLLRVLPSEDVAHLKLAFARFIPRQLRGSGRGQRQVFTREIEIADLAATPALEKVESLA